MTDTPYRQYRPTLEAQVKAESRLNIGLKLGYGKEYTVALMIEAALDVDFYYAGCSPETADRAGVKVWAGDLYARWA